MIIDEFVNVKIGTKNINHFKKLNYICKVGEIILVKPIDLMNCSKNPVHVKCDICGKEKIIPYRSYFKNISKFPIYCCGTLCSKIKENQTKKEKYGDNYEKHRVNKMKKTNKKRYGNENTSQIFRNEKNINDFLFELKNIYTDLDFSKINYINNYTKIEIICKKHGLFKIRPNELLDGQGCKKCNKEIRKHNSLKKYIEKANQIHNNKYDYSKVVFNTILNNIIIICPDHGDFIQSLHNHINSKQGCPKCSHNYNKKDWIKLYSEKHNNKYDYSLIEYINSNIKIKIICPEHGIFKQLPSTHLNGIGCPYCANKKRRLFRIKTISKNKFNGEQIMPSFNEKACDLFDKISKNENIYIQHAKNDGEFYIKELGYWVDGYDKENNVVYEYDEKHHFRNGKLNKKDQIRQKEISDLLKCKFVRIKD